MKNLFIVCSETQIRDHISASLHCVAGLAVLQFSSVERSLNNYFLVPDFIVVFNPLEFGQLASIVKSYRHLNEVVKIIVISPEHDMRLFTAGTHLGLTAIFAAEEQSYGSKIRQVVEMYLQEHTEHEVVVAGNEKERDQNFTGGNELIYVLEDDRNMTRLLEKVLSNAGKFSVSIFHNSRSFFETFLKLPPKYVVLDHYLNGDLNGLEVLKRIKKNDGDTKVIVFSSQTSVDTARNLIYEGADYYLYKSNENIARLVEYVSNLNK